LLNKDATLLEEWKALATAAERGAFVEALKGAWKGGRGPNWVEIEDIAKKIADRKSHVREVENLNATKELKKGGIVYNLEGYTGLHTENAAIEFCAKNGATYDLKNKTKGIGGVFECQPVIYKNGKEYVKCNGTFVEYEAGKWGGTSTMFPSHWDDPRIMEEVTHAIENNHGLVANQSAGGNLMFGYSKNGLVEIRFAFNLKSNGTYGGTYYAILKNY
jgi:hypothetical protein